MTKPRKYADDGCRREDDHCYHLEDKRDCRKFGINKNRVLRCCKCGAEKRGMLD